MMKISFEDFKIGKIIKVNQFIEAAVLIQTFDIPVTVSKNSIQKVIFVNTEDELVECIRNINFHIFIYSITSFTVDDNIFTALKSINYKGYNVYVYQLDNDRHWFIDEEEEEKDG